MLSCHFFASFLKKLNIEYGLNPGICIALGTITGCFGGVLQDVLLNNVPLIFHKEIHASASIAGGAVYFLLLTIKIDDNLANVMGIVIIFMIRLFAVRFNWSLPKFYERRKE